MRAVSAEAKVTILQDELRLLIKYAALLASSSYQYDKTIIIRNSEIFKMGHLIANSGWFALRLRRVEFPVSTSWSIPAIDCVRRSYYYLFLTSLRSLY